MNVIKTIREMQNWSDKMRMAGHIIGFVPTMGFLHKGHLELMRIAKQHCDTLVVSIFVNPIQFGPEEDLKTYPRDTHGDLEKLRKLHVDAVFMPQSKDMYPHGFQTEIQVKSLSQHLCGRSRPGHFTGVATVVTKLFNITKPHVAVFGQKDFQQLQVIRRLIIDQNMDIKIIGAPIVREPDGLAMSSRNSYLSHEERKSALCLKQSIDMAHKMLKEGVIDCKAIKTKIKDLILSYPFTQIDYITFCNTNTLEEVDILKDETLLAMAVRVGKTRLIDNTVLRKNMTDQADNQGSGGL